MPEYRVTWEMDIEADTPQDAAKQARQYQLDPTAIVGVFDVRDHATGAQHRVDLDELAGETDL